MKQVGAMGRYRGQFVEDGASCMGVEDGSISSWMVYGVAEGNQKSFRGAVLSLLNCSPHVTK